MRAPREICSLSYCRNRPTKSSTPGCLSMCTRPNRQSSPPASSRPRRPYVSRPSMIVDFANPGQCVCGVYTQDVYLSCHDLQYMISTRNSVHVCVYVYAQLHAEWVWFPPEATPKKDFLGSVWVCCLVS